MTFGKDRTSEIYFGVERNKIEYSKDKNPRLTARVFVCITQYQLSDR